MSNARDDLNPMNPPVPPKNEDEKAKNDLANKKKKEDEDYKEKDLANAQKYYTDKWGWNEWVDVSQSKEILDENGVNGMYSDNRKLPKGNYTWVKKGLPNANQPDFSGITVMYDPEKGSKFNPPNAGERGHQAVMSLLAQAGVKRVTFSWSREELGFLHEKADGLYARDDALLKDFLKRRLSHIMQAMKEAEKYEMAFSLDPAAREFLTQYQSYIGKELTELFEKEKASQLKYETHRRVDDFDHRATALNDDSLSDIKHFDASLRTDEQKKKAEIATTLQSDAIKDDSSAEEINTQLDKIDARVEKLNKEGKKSSGAVSLLEDPHKILHAAEDDMLKAEVINNPDRLRAHDNLLNTIEKQKVALSLRVTAWEDELKKLSGNKTLQEKFVKHKTEVTSAYTDANKDFTKAQTLESDIKKLHAEMLKLNKDITALEADKTKDNAATIDQKTTELLAKNKQMEALEGDKVTFDDKAKALIAKKIEELKAEKAKDPTIDVATKITDLEDKAKLIGIKEDNNKTLLATLKEDLDQKKTVKDKVEKLEDPKVKIEKIQKKCEDTKKELTALQTNYEKMRELNISLQEKAENIKTTRQRL